MNDTRKLAHDALGRRFGTGREIAMREIETNPVTNAIYECAISELIERIEAGRPKKTIDIITAELLKPYWVEQYERGTEDVFDPWRAFPSLYGSYSRDFDDVAIEVLENIRDSRFGEETTAHRMFREMLCTADLCDYGTSPRGCFANWEFKAVLPALIDRWKIYRKMEWGEE